MAEAVSLQRDSLDEHVTVVQNSCEGLVVDVLDGLNFCELAVRKRLDSYWGLVGSDLAYIGFKVDLSFSVGYVEYFIEVVDMHVVVHHDGVLETVSIRDQSCSVGYESRKQQP